MSVKPSDYWWTFRSVTVNSLIFTAPAPRTVQSVSLNFVCPLDSVALLMAVAVIMAVAVLVLVTVVVGFISFSATIHIPRKVQWSLMRDF